MSIAKAITNRMAGKGAQRSSRSIYTLLSDDHNVHCMTEEMLDAWWASLSAEEKAEAFDIFDDAAAAPATPITLTAEFEANSSRFLADMERISKSPFAGLTAGGL